MGDHRNQFHPFSEIPCCMGGAWSAKTEYPSHNVLPCKALKAAYQTISCKVLNRTSKNCRMMHSLRSTECQGGLTHQPGGR